jgi:hypothetical protein
MVMASWIANRRASVKNVFEKTDVRSRRELVDVTHAALQKTDPGPVRGRASAPRVDRLEGGVHRRARRIAGTGLPVGRDTL